MLFLQENVVKCLDKMVTTPHLIFASLFKSKAGTNANSSRINTEIQSALYIMVLGNDYSATEKVQLLGIRF